MFMKNIYLILLFFCLASVNLFASDYIRLGEDSIPTGSDDFDLVFHIERTCPSPATITGATNGFVITATGDVTYQYVNCYQDAGSSINWNLTDFVCNTYIDNNPPDSFLTGGAGMNDGIPIVFDEPYFHLILDIGPGEGELCFDSSNIGSNPWIWAGLTCGQGGAPNRPLFVDKYNSDANHPICITIYEDDESEDYIRLGVDSVLANSEDVDFTFYAKRTCPSPTLITGASNGFEIIATGLATYQYVTIYQDPGSSIDWDMTGLIVYDYFDNGFPDSMLVGGVAMMSGMPIMDEEPYFHMILDIGPGMGEICIDSAFINPAGNWIWLDLTCGQGGAPDRPLFLDKNYSDDNHPICITVYDVIEDYIRLGVDSIVEESDDVDIPFYIKRTCPDPTNIMGISNGFVITATGDVTYQFDHFYADPGNSLDFNLTGILCNSNGIDNSFPDSFFVGAAAMAPAAGLPIIGEEPYFHLVFDIGSGEGELCFDSAFVEPAGEWKWYELTCGQGGAPDRPLFIDKYGSDDNHPICITVHREINRNDYIRLGVDSILAGTDDFDMVFHIQRTCPSPANIMGSTNGFEITATGDVTYQYKNYYQDPGSSVNWELGGLLMTQALDGNFPDTFLVGGAAMFEGLPIITDEPYFHLILDIGPGTGELCIDSAFVFSAGEWRWSGLTCGLGGAPHRPQFVDKYGSDDNHPICITVFAPYICGDSNGDKDVNVSDAVYIINYVFVGGDPPDPLVSGDVNCDTDVNVSDAVWIINYVFVGGNVPCDSYPATPNGDGIPDC
jgi:hypothetical protein